MNDQNNNPLNMSLNDMDTSMPNLAAGVYDFSITKVELVKTKKEPAVPMLKGEMKTVDASTSVAGDPLAAGQMVFFQVILQPTGKADWGMVGRNVAQLVQSAQLDLNAYGANGKDQLAAAPTWHKQLEGRLVRAKINFVPESVDPVSGKSYRAKNEVAYFSKR